MLTNQLDNKRTKIVATIGPASWDEDTLRRMIRAGMNVARINFSHGDHERHSSTIDLVRQIAQEEGAVVAIMCDIQGPKIRIGKIEKEPLMLQKGDKVTLTLDEKATGKDNIIALPHPEFMRDIRTGMQLLLDDGNLEFTVQEVAGGVLVCEVVIGGKLTSRKGVMAPKARLSLSAITAKDREDVELALAKNTDYIAMSFVRSEEDIRELRWLIRHLGGEAAVIAKIEKHEALENIEAIIKASEGIMVARGDLGLETPAEEVPYHQKRIINLCNLASKPVITATQMLNSMVESPRPTRAEASDVYNAIVDGTDAVMLSNETAAGKYPIVAVETMAMIAGIAEQHMLSSRQRIDHAARFEVGSGDDAIADSISEATYHISIALNPRAIVTSTITGYTTRRVARERPSAPILCVTPNESTYRRMALVWGVLPLLIPRFNTIDEMIALVVEASHNASLVKKGDILILIAGVPFGVGGQTNLLKIHRVGESGEL